MADYLVQSGDDAPASGFAGTLSGNDTLTIAQHALLGTPDGPPAVTFDLAPAPAGFAGGVLIDNSGTLRAGSTAVATTGASAAPRSLTVLNEAPGTVVANGPGASLALGAETDAVMNYGTLQASATGTAVSLGAGNDELDLYTGSTAQGLLDGGDGRDTLNLSLGAPSRTGTLAGVSNFETLNVNAGTWTVTDGQGYVGGIAIGNVASLVLGQAGAASATGPATTGSLTGAISDAGTLTVAQTGSLTLANAISGGGGVVQSGTGTTALAGANSFSGGATLTAGTLEIAAAGAAGSFGVTASGNATLRVDAGASVATAGAAITDDLTQAGGGIGGLVIDNAGTVASAGASAIRATGTGADPRFLTLTNEAGATIAAPGTAAAAVQLGAEADTVLNFGTIAATGPSGTAISLGAGNDELDLYTGAPVGGRIDGGAGTDTLNLTVGAPARTGTLSQVSNFEALTVNSGAWTVTDGQGYAGGITIGGVASLTLGQGGTAGAVIGGISDAGTLAVNRADTFSLANAITGAGSLVQAGPGTTILTSANSFSGGATLTAGTLELAVPGAAGSFDIAFSGQATLALDGTALPANRIDGFAAGDAINLRSLAYDASDTVSASGSVVTLGVGGARYTFAITGVGALGLSGAADGSLVLSQAPCYAAGVRIATPDGERPVEDLRAGDPVTLASGGTAPIRWVGHRRVDLRRHPRPEAARPVRIRAGSFGSGLPRRDLLLSPEHALFVDGALIPAHVLVDGASVVQEAWDHVTYHHVELDRHDVILAEGLPAETYLDTGNRSDFANGVLASLHPDFAAGSVVAEPCAPLLLDGPVVEGVRARLRAAASARAA